MSSPTAEMTDEVLLALLREASNVGAGVRRNLAKAIPALSASPQPVTPTDALPSSLSVAAGTRDWQNTCVVGKNGYIFILEGSNSLLSAHKPDRALVDKQASGWRELINARSGNINEKGMRFLQCIIPEKSTILPEHFPIERETEITPLFVQVEGDLSASDDYLSALTVIRQSGVRDQTFQKADSHLSPEGCRVLINGMLRHLQLECEFPPFTGEEALWPGDLGGKFTPVTFLNYVRPPPLHQYAAWEVELQQQDAATAGAGHQGRYVSFHNPGAPVDAKVFAFGNSFFETGARPSNLTWWAARCFRSFHFAWSAEVDYSLLEVLEPDIVICQTNERFLQVVPAS